MPTKIEIVAAKCFATAIEAIADIAQDQRWTTQNRETAMQVCGELQELLEHAKAQVELLPKPQPEDRAEVPQALVELLTPHERGLRIAGAVTAENYQEAGAELGALICGNAE